jgi:hypothetical protein
MNASRKIILSISSIVFLGLLSFSPWYETNGQYVKQLGRYFFSSKPEAVPVECYFVGCVTALASYFRVMLSWRPWVETLSTIAFIATGLFLLFGTRADGNPPSIGNPKTRLAFSAVVALALPISMSPVLLVGTYGHTYQPFSLVVSTIGFGAAYSSRLSFSYTQVRFIS